MPDTLVILIPECQTEFKNDANGLSSALHAERDYPLSGLAALFFKMRQKIR